MKNYLVYAEYNYYDEHYSQILYVGNDEQKAFNLKELKKDSGLDEYMFFLEIWIDGIQYQGYSNAESNTFELNFDRSKDLIERAKQLNDELDQAKQKLKLFE